MEESASTSSLPWPVLLSQTWRYRLSPNLWPLPISCILFLPDFLETSSPQKQPILPVTWIPFFSLLLSSSPGIFPSGYFVCSGLFHLPYAPLHYTSPWTITAKLCKSSLHTVSPLPCHLIHSWFFFCQSEQSFEAPLQAVLPEVYFYSFSAYIPVNYFRHSQTSVPLHMLSPLPQISFSFFYIFILLHLSWMSAFSFQHPWSLCLSHQNDSRSLFLFLYHALLAFSLLWTLPVMPHLIPTTTIWGKYYYPSYTNEKTEA